MFTFKLVCVLISLFFHGCDCQRRIKDGDVVTVNKPYVVYFLKAAVSPRYYDAWICGGTLVSPDYIVTSAACVTDVTHLYAIAGYNKYVRDTEINNDACTKAKKKKVVLICTPKIYEFQFEEITKWSNIDIAVVKVESPYDLADKSFEEVCSYIPQPIIINYELKFQEPGIDAIVLGWGHRAKYREQLDPTDYNEEKLNYAPTLLQDKKECKKEYAIYAGMDHVIDKYMLCTFEKGNINDAGETILKAKPTAEGCDIPPERRRLSDNGVTCDPAFPDQEIVLIENTRKDLLPHNKTINLNIDKTPNVVNDTIIIKNISKIIKNDPLSLRRMHTRRHGICQNDHGGPLVTWVGSHEVLIGVASVFKITDTLDCIGPYLFTSTQCNGAFLDCILQSDPKKTPSMRRAICNNATAAGFKLDERHISWKDHPDGPAHSELHDIHALTITNGSSINQTNTNKTENQTQKVNINFRAQENATDKNIVHSDTLIYNASKFIEDSLVSDLNPITKKVEITTASLPTTAPFNATSVSTSSVSQITVDKNVTVTMRTVENRVNVTATTVSTQASTTTVAQKLVTNKS